MSLSLWDYIRRRACHAFLAGLQDALDQVERQDQPQQIYASAAALKKRLLDCPGPNALPTKTESSPVREKPPAPSTPGNIAPPPKNPSPAPQAPPSANGVPPTPGGRPPREPERRKPGRPRKETYG